MAKKIVKKVVGKKPAVKASSNPASGKKKGKSGSAEKIEVITPVGMFSYPHLAAPKTKGEYADDKYQVDLIVNKKVWAKSDEAVKLKAAIVKVAKANGLGTDLREFKNPLRDLDLLDDVDKRLKGCIALKAKSAYEPLIVGPTMNEDGKLEKLDAAEIKAIKGGDTGRLKVGVGYYPQKGGGVTLYLNVVQFKQEGEALGDGVGKKLEGFDEMEVEVDDLEESDEDEQEESEEETEEESDESEEDESDGEDSEEVEEEVEEEEEEEVEEEEELPKGRKGKVQASKKSTGKSGKTKKSSEFQF